MLALKFQHQHDKEIIAMTLATILQTETGLELHADTAFDLMVPNPISLRAEANISEALR